MVVKVPTEERTRARFVWQMSPLLTREALVLWLYDIGPCGHGEPFEDAAAYSWNRL